MFGLIVNQLEVNDITMMGSLDGVASALQVELRDNADGTRSGVSPIIWGSWETTGVDVDFDLDVSNEVEQVQTQSERIPTLLPMNLKVCLMVVTR